MDIAKSVFNCDLRRTISQLGGRATEFNFLKSYSWVSLAQLSVFIDVPQKLVESMEMYIRDQEGPVSCST